MTGRQGQHGSASVAALTLLLLLSAVAAGALLLLQASLIYERRSVERDETRQALEKEAEATLQALAQDPTPDSDSPLDPVWESLSRPESSGITVTLRDLSSAVDPNWVQKNLLQKTRLNELFLPGRTAEELQQRREDKGFSTDIVAAYGDLFQEGALDKYFTGFGYANINVTDEFALRKLYFLRTGDQARADEFHTRVQGLLLDRRLLKPEEVRTFLGSDYDTFSPVMGVEPVMNVHYVDPMVLLEILSHPDLKIPKPQDAGAGILQRRESSELTADDLRQIIGAAPENRIYQYLGVRTWFWRITIQRNAARLEQVAARLPGEKGSRGRFLVVEEKYTW